MDLFADDEPRQYEQPAVKVKPSSRLIVKNIPKHITDARLKAHFATKGEVTDVKILKTKDGRSRKFAFVGFTSVDAAKEARVYFDNTYVDTSKISIEYALPYGDTTIPRAWSKYSKDSSAYEKKQENAEKIATNNSQAWRDQKKEGLKIDVEKDAKLQEFIVANKAKSKVWMNDDSAVATMNESQTPDKNAKKRKSKVENVAVQAVPNRKPGGEGMFVNRTHVTFDAADDESSDDEEYQELPASKKAKKDDGEESNDDNADAMDVDATKSEDHLSLIKANMRSADDIERLIAEEEARAASGVPEEHPVVKSEENEGTKEGVKVDEGVKAEDDGVDKDGEKSDESIDIVDPAAETAAATTTDGKRKYDNVGTVEDLAETGRIFVRNLPFTTVEDDLFKLFSKYGQVSEVHISVDKSTKSSKGIGFVLFLMPQDAVKAFNELDGKIFQGRLMHLLPAAAVQRKEPKTANDQKFQTEFQKRKEQKMKELSGQDFNWNPLFIRADTVAQAMAAQYNVEKGDIYDRDSKSSVAVRLALGEAKIIADTKKFLEDEGVSLDALKGHYQKNLERSNTIILAKNIPFTAQIEELRSMFSAYGPVVKAVMPPSHSLALIEFGSSNDAKSAYRNLAYKQFKDAPLFLEWAPTGVFGKKDAMERVKPVEDAKPVATPAAAPQKAAEKPKKPTGPTAEELKKQEEEAKKKKELEAMEEEVEAQDESAGQDTTNTTLYVKNLNFATMEETLKRTVERLVGAVRSVTIAKHKVKDQMMSQGFGFIECKDREQALKAYKTINGITIDNHQLRLSFAQRGVQEDNSSKRKNVVRGKPTTKLMVRNVPFQATKKEIRHLFAAFGELRSVRLPSKAGGKGHRGFAFVEFLTKDEAKNALEALANTRLYGRHIVIEFGNEDETVEQLQEKTAKQFSTRSE